MASFKEAPAEVMDAILSFLEDVELLPLLASSHGFMDYVIDVLDRRRANGKSMAMRWACLHGHLPIIRLLVSSGAPASTVDIEWNHWDKKTEKWAKKKAKVLTLYLAAARRQVQAFELLIKLGARIDCPGVERRGLRRLMDSICNPADNWAILRLFYQNELHSQIRFDCYPQLERVVRRSPIPETGWPVQMLVDAGIDPNERHLRHKHVPSNPLVAAIRVKSESMVDLLVSQGACIHGPKIGPLGKKPWPIPILAAAENMSKNGPGMIDVCLRNGADINHCAWRELREPYHSRNDYCDNYCITPFLAYLHSITNWDEQSHAIHPVQAIEFLIERGSWVEQPVHPTFEGPHYDTKLAFTRWGMELLLRKWGLAELMTSACFRATIYFLLQHAVRNGNIGESLARYDFERDWEGKKSVNVLTPWQEILTYLLEVEKLDPTELLYHYILHKGRLAMRLLDVGQATIDRLLAAGANIHGRLQPNGPTALEELCRIYNANQHGAVEECRARGGTLRKNHIQLVLFLVSRGITSSVDTPAATAIDLLTFDLDGMDEYNAEEALLLTRILRGYQCSPCLGPFVERPP